MTPLAVPASDQAAAYAERFGCLANPARIRLLHAVAAGEVTVGALAEVLGVSQPTCSHHLRKLAAAGFVQLRRDGTATLASVDPSGRVVRPHAIDAVLGVIPAGPRRRRRCRRECYAGVGETSLYVDARVRGGVWGRRCCTGRCGGG